MDLRKLLRDRFGFDSFRRGQENVIRAVLSGSDTLAVFPTGAGKSLCYQLPCLAKPGFGVVVSPLKALMQDQVKHCIEKGIQAKLWNEDVSKEDKDYLRIDLPSSQPKTEILFITPESLLNQFALFKSCAKNVILFAVDEAHCISSWGHDFRSSFLRLGKFRAAFPKAPCICVTATATLKVRGDICTQMCLKNPRLFVDGFDRPNIYYQVHYKETQTDLYGHVYSVLARSLKNGGSGIIYCRKKAECDELVVKLQGKIGILAYHSGISSRSEVQAKWQRGEVKVLAATIAFGMGIDKSNVRVVVHWCFSSSIEAYYQESGRAGRDGKPSSAVLYFGEKDRNAMEYIASQTFKKQQQKASLRKKKLLEEQYLKRVKMLKSMVSYAESKCRRQSLLAYFGDSKGVASLRNRKRKRCCDVCSNPGDVKRRREEACAAHLASRMRTTHKGPIFRKKRSNTKSRRRDDLRRRLDPGDSYEFDPESHGFSSRYVTESTDESEEEENAGFRRRLLSGKPFRKKRRAPMRAPIAKRPKLQPTTPLPKYPQLMISDSSSDDSD